MIVRGNVLALEGLDLDRAHDRGKIGILTAGFHDASPARIARQIDHGGEGNVNARRSRLACRHFGALVKKRGIKAARHGRADGIERTEAVNDVVHKEQRNVVAVVLYMLALQGDRVLRLCGTEAGAHTGDLLERHAPLLCRACDLGEHAKRAGADLDQLANLFLQRHLCK